MKKRWAVCVLGVLVLCSQMIAQGQQSGDLPIRVLFIGNSYTYFNNLPAVLTELSLSQKGGPHITTEMIVVGGATLKQHFEGTQAVSKIKEGDWDYVVLQEQSTLGRSKYINGVPSINDPGIFHRYVRLFHAEITKQGAQTVLMLTWSRKNSPQSQANLTDAYMAIGRELNARVAPVGLVWERVFKRADGPELYMEDGSHPSPQGTYCAACVIYATITGKSPENLPHRIKVPDIDMAGKPVISRAAYQDIELSQRDAALIHEEVWSLHRHLCDRGGYTEAMPAPNPQEPAVPQGLEFSDADLIGTWEGSAFLGLTPDPTELTFDLSNNGQSFRAKIDLDFNGIFIPDQNHEIRAIDVTQSHLRFSHPLKMTYEDVDAHLDYDLVFTGDSLNGVARMILAGDERGVSEVYLRRRQ